MCDPEQMKNYLTWALRMWAIRVGGVTGDDLKSFRATCHCSGIDWQMLSLGTIQLHDAAAKLNQVIFPGVGHLVTWAKIKAELDAREVKACVTPGWVEE